MKVALVTDSNAQMPLSLVEQYGIDVVPLIVTIDGEDYREGVDLTSTEFYDRLGRGATVSTAAPSPGSVLAAYERAAALGADALLSIHIGSNTSATLNAVMLAANMSPVPVTTVDTGTASFAVGCCVWAAADRLASGGTLDDAAATAARVARSVGNVFVVDGLGLAAAGGRLASGAESEHDLGAAVLALESGRMQVVDRVPDRQAAIDAMVSYVAMRSRGVRQRIGVGDAIADEFAVEFVDALERAGIVEELVRYEVGPSVGAHTGAGTVGAVFFGVE